MIIFSTSDKNIIAQLDADIESWNNFKNEYDALYNEGKYVEAEALEIPISNIPIIGEIVESDDYYHNEFKKTLKGWGYTNEELSGYSIFMTIKDYN